MEQRVKELLRQCEKLLRDADAEVVSAQTPLSRKRYTRRRNALNAACNALYRADRA